ncbi:MAG: clostripain-related cysteine peptidase [Defluviitaleaceae bacterium]|nr:clostripain-related cysteine peptidase [Defluviitaleaceae bacterium]
MFRKIYILFTFICVILVAGCSSGRGPGADYAPDTTPAPVRSAPGAARDAGRPVAHDFTLHAHISPQAKKPLTIMVYMNGSDLESLYGAGTDDIFEMIDSGYDEDLMNVVLFTGGSMNWWLEDIPDDVNTIFWLRGGELVRVADVGEDSTGDPRVLAGFIRLAREYFPSERSGLILWNHGGGAVVGYGADERFEHYPDIAMMKLSDIGLALELGGIGPDDKLKFLGFDTCLMATIEMAKIARDYAGYLIASEEVEPEQGWDYTFLGDIKPECDGRAIGAYVIQRYAEFYKGSDEVDLVTMSLVDLSKIGPIAESFENFALSAGEALSTGEFRRLSRARRRTRNFGSGGEDGESDMVDIKEMAYRLGGTIDQGIISALNESLDEAVIINYQNRDYKLGGLSVYYPYFNKEGLDDNLQTYAAMNTLPNYTAYIVSFAEELQSPRIWRKRSARAAREADARFALTPQEADEAAQIRLTTWQRLESAGDGAYIQVGETPHVRLNNDLTLEYEEEVFRLGGRLACLYSDGALTDRRTIPALLNGEEANIIVRSDAPGGQWRVIGAIPTTNGAFNTVDKKLVRIADGDKVALRYYLVHFDEHGDIDDQRQDEKWHIGEEFIVEGGLSIASGHENTDALSRKLNLIDYRNNNHFIRID